MKLLATKVIISLSFLLLFSGPVILTKEVCAQTPDLPISIDLELADCIGSVKGCVPEFTIKKLDNCYSSNLLIVNRWGGVVYEKKKGGGKIRWDGTHNGKKLQEGTYYYMLDYQMTKDVSTKGRSTGPIYLLKKGGGIK